MKEDLQKIEEDLNKARIQYEKIGKKITKLYDKQQAIKEKITKEKIENNSITMEELLFSDGIGQTRSCRTKLDEFLSQYNLRSYGYYHDTSQVCIHIMLKEQDLEHAKKSAEGICVLFPHLKPMKVSKFDEGNGKFVCISIDEYTLSEHGVYQLLIDENQICYLCKTAWGTMRTLHKFDDIYKALEHCCVYHPYERKEVESDDDFEEEY